MKFCAVIFVWVFCVNWYCKMSGPFFYLITFINAKPGKDDNHGTYETGGLPSSEADLQKQCCVKNCYARMMTANLTCPSGLFLKGMLLFAKMSRL